MVVLVLVLLFFGPKRLPGLGARSDPGIREFKEAITGDHPADEDERSELTSVEHRLGRVGQRGG